MKSGASQIGSILSCIELVSSVVLFHKKDEEDFVLSKGHAAVALYVSLNKKGEISDSELSSFRNEGTRLPSHPAPMVFKSIKFSAGSLGHGLPFAAGLALSNKLKNKRLNTYVLISDGETNEGTTWESMHFAVKHNLDNLIVIIDKNKIQGFDFTRNVLGDTCKPVIWDKTGWEYREINGHDVIAIKNTLEELSFNKNGRPKLIIADTVKGKGVSFMENTVEWQYLTMTDEQFIQAIAEISKV